LRLGVTTAEDVGADAGGAAWQLTLVNGIKTRKLL